MPAREPPPCRHATYRANLTVPEGVPFCAGKRKSCPRRRPVAGWPTRAWGSRGIRPGRLEWQDDSPCDERRSEAWPSLTYSHGDRGEGDKVRDRITVALRALLTSVALCGGAWPALAASQLTVFGDSYSVPVHGGAPTWVTQLKDERAVGNVHDFAKSGAVAADQARTGSPARSACGTRPAILSGIPSSISATTILTARSP